MTSGMILMVLAFCLFGSLRFAKSGDDDGGIATSLNFDDAEPEPQDNQDQDPTEVVDDDTDADDDTGEADEDEEESVDPDQDDADAGEDSPPEIDDDLRKMADGLFTDSQLKAFAGNRKQLEAAIEAVAARVLGAKDYNAPRTNATGNEPQNAKPPTQEPVPSEFKIDINEDEYEENPAKATAKALQSLMDRVDQRISQIDGTVQQVGQAYQQQGASVARQKQERLATEADRVRKELGPEFANLLGHRSIREVMLRPDSEEFRNNDALFTALNDWAMYRGITDPAQWTADLARQAMRGIGIPAFVEALEREPRKKLVKKINSTAKGAAPKPSTRSQDQRKLSWDERKAQLVRDAQKKIGY